MRSVVILTNVIFKKYILYNECENIRKIQDFPGGAVIENPPANTGNMGSIPGLGRSHLLRNNKACAP